MPPASSDLTDIPVTTMSRIVRFCAEECERQQSGESSVADMVDAWMEAVNYLTITPERILRLGRLVEPNKNRHGYRTVPVRVGWQPVRVTPRQVPGQIVKLASSWDNLEPAEIFKEFEEIHPFVDGNGRVGAILYNWFSATMDTPQIAPDFWANDPFQPMSTMQVAEATGRTIWTGETGRPL